VFAVSRSGHLVSDRPCFKFFFAAHDLFLCFADPFL